MPTCGNGHDSEWDDYCSICGESLTPALETPEAPKQGAAETTPTCSNCSELHADGDVFCENCGFDFLSGTLPDQQLDETAEATNASKETETAAAVIAEVAIVEVDAEFFERMGFAGVEVPVELPDPVRIELPPTNILVGRHSETRGTFPEIDLSSAFGDDSPANDPAVSSNHCRLQRGDSGWTVTDLDSTNGTYIDGADDPLKPGVATSLSAGTAIYVGAWTKITIE